MSNMTIKQSQPAPRRRAAGSVHLLVLLAVPVAVTLAACQRTPAPPVVSTPAATPTAMPTASSSPSLVPLPTQPSEAYPAPTQVLVPGPYPAATEGAAGTTPPSPGASPAAPGAAGGTPAETPESPGAQATPAGAFGQIWEELGGARASIGARRSGERGVDGAVQTFTSGGKMIWIKADPPVIYVLYADGKLQRYPDENYVGSGTPTPAPVPCNPPQTTRGEKPLSGFGRVWCQNELWKSLGWGEESEKGLHVRYQDFEYGRMLCSTPRDVQGPDPVPGCRNAVPRSMVVLNEQTNTWEVRPFQ